MLMFVVVMLLPTHFFYEWVWGRVAFVDKIVEIISPDTRK